LDVGAQRRGAARQRRGGGVPFRPRDGPHLRLPRGGGYPRAPRLRLGDRSPLPPTTLKNKLKIQAQTSSASRRTPPPSTTFTKTRLWSSPQARAARRSGASRRTRGLRALRPSTPGGTCASSPPPPRFIKSAAHARKSSSPPSPRGSNTPSPSTVRGGGGQIHLHFCRPSHFAPPLPTPARPPQCAPHPPPLRWRRALGVGRQRPGPALPRRPWPPQRRVRPHPPARHPRVDLSRRQRWVLPHPRPLKWGGGGGVVVN
jgi:hypothetical protein